MKDFFKDLYAYNYHSNQQLCEVFEKKGSLLPSKAITLFSHILNAHHIWIKRMSGFQPDYGVWQEHNMDTFKTVDTVNYDVSIHIIEQSDLNTIVYYNNTKGEAFQNTVRDILFHVINHSTYHRAQIATEFRKYGLEPIMTDYIFYRR